MSAMLRSLKHRNAPHAPLGIYPESGQRIILQGYDLTARFWLVDRAEETYDAGDRRASAMLMHAAYYLEDRLAYQLYPAPKNCIRIEPESVSPSAPPDLSALRKDWETGGYECSWQQFVEWFSPSAPVVGNEKAVRE